MSEKKLGSLLEAHGDELLNCVHCGLCLPACPTYRVLGNENDSPRGRIYLMRGVVEGKLSLGATFTRHIDLCLGCRACETACPSGVPYGHLLEAARSEIVEKQAAPDRWLARLVSLVLNQVFTRPRLLAFSMKLAKFFRNSGLAELAFSTNLVSGRLQFALAVLLASRSPFASSAKPRDVEIINAAAASSTTAAATDAGATRVGVLRGCVMEGLFAETNRATERVLRRQGCELAEVKAQGCCGALHAHAGHLETARELARRNIEAFLQSGCEWIVVNSAGCGAAMKEYKDWLADDAPFAEQARAFSAKVKDVSEFVMERGVALPAKAETAPPVTPVTTFDVGATRKPSLRHAPPLRVTYDAPCHLMHAQRLVNPPLELLRQLPGVEFTMLAGYEHCCGGAGIYNLQHPELSAEILDAKLANIRATGAEMVATANPGCIMQIGAGALMNNLNVRVVHPIELLDAAYQEEDAAPAESS